VTYKYRRPARPCPFCKSMQTCLSRHIRRKHKGEQVVQKLMSESKDKQMKQMKQLKKEGIMEHNMSYFAQKTTVIMRERECNRKKEVPTADRFSNLKVCSSCKGVYDRKYIWRHKLRCEKIESGQQSNPSLSVHALISTSEDEFSQNVLAKLREDEIGNIARTDPVIARVGSHYYRKGSKKDRHLVMTHMRRLAQLLKHFRDVCSNSKLSAEDMLDRSKFNELIEALNNMCDTKHNLKLSLGYLLKKTAEVQQGSFLVQGREDRFTELKYFLKTLTHHWGEVFGDAMWLSERRRQEKLRKPGLLPLETDLSLLRQYSVTTLNTLVHDQYKMFGVAEFRKLRSVIVTRLTVFNARRGSEPARLLLREWEDAEAGEWLDSQVVTNLSTDDQSIVSRHKLTYQAGKGTKDLVPLLIPDDAVHGIRKLVANREECGVPLNNPYVFPYLQGSLDHVIGWHEMKQTCKEAGVSEPKLITANHVRHRAATVHAGLEMPERERNAFYRHMAHSQKMDEHVYQCPLGVTEVTKVGRYLEELESGKYRGIDVQFSAS